VRAQDVELLIAFLRQVQQERHYSLRGLAQRLGVSSGHLCMVLSGRRRPGLHLIQAVLTHLPAYRELWQRQFDTPAEGTNGQRTRR
jgi:transcriptional regulator with XRE-family HTH domain